MVILADYTLLDRTINSISQSMGFIVFVKTHNIIGNLSAF
jgi:hypothetical protein